MTAKKKRGGHITGFRHDISSGSGPVFEIRAALGLSQTEMAEKLGYSSYGTVYQLEARGGVPKSPVFQDQLREAAAGISPKVLSKETRDWLKT